MNVCKAVLVINEFLIINSVLTSEVVPMGCKTDSELFESMMVKEQVMVQADLTC